MTTSEPKPQPPRFISLVGIEGEMFAIASLPALHAPTP